MWYKGWTWTNRKAYLSIFDLAGTRHLSEPQELARVRNDGVALHGRDGDDLVTLCAKISYNKGSVRPRGRRESTKSAQD